MCKSAQVRFVLQKGEKDSVTDKQKRFADEYMIDCNATRAYKAIYTRVKSDAVAQVNGSRMLLNAMVKNYIEEQLNDIRSAKIADTTEIMEYADGNFVRTFRCQRYLIRFRLFRIFVCFVFLN